jgi:hypothetical protein
VVVRSPTRPTPVTLKWPLNGRLYIGGLITQHYWSFCKLTTPERQESRPLFQGTLLADKSSQRGLGNSPFLFSITFFLAPTRSFHSLPPRHSITLFTRLRLTQLNKPSPFCSLCCYWSLAMLDYLLSIPWSNVSRYWFNSLAAHSL